MKKLQSVLVMVFQYIRLYLCKRIGRWRPRRRQRALSVRHSTDRACVTDTTRYKIAHGISLPEEEGCGGKQRTYASQPAKGEGGTRARRVRESRGWVMRCKRSRAEKRFWARRNEENHCRFCRDCSTVPIATQRKRSPRCAAVTTPPSRRECVATTARWRMDRGGRRQQPVVGAGRRARALLRRLRCARRWAAAAAGGERGPAHVRGAAPRQAGHVFAGMAGRASLPPSTPAATPRPAAINVRLAARRADGLAWLRSVRAISPSLHTAARTQEPRVASSFL
jgi:hypothetical protein